MVCNDDGDDDVHVSRLGFTWCMPRSHWWTCRVHGCVLWLTTWASLVLLLLMLQDNAQDSGCSLFLFLCSPMVVRVAFSLSDTRHPPVCPTACHDKLVSIPCHDDCCVARYL
jgi:hypothetical protein